MQDRTVVFARKVAMTLRRNAHAAGGVGLAQIVGAVSLALGTRLITEVIDPDSYGSYKLVIGIVTFVNGLILMPLIRFSMREVHDAAAQDGAPSFVGTTRRSIAIVSMVSGGFGLFTITAIAIAAGREAIIGMAAAGVALLILQAQFNLEAGLLTSTGRPVLASAFRAGSSVLLPALLVGAFTIRAGVTSMVLAHALVFGLILIWIRRTNLANSVGSVRDWLSNSRQFALPLIPVAVLTWLFSVGDRYLLAWLTNIDTVGRYAVVYGLAAAPLAIAGGLIPSISYEPIFRATSQDDEASSRSLIRRTVGAQVVLIATAVAVIIAFAPIAADLLLAESYREGAPRLIRWIALGQGALVATYGLDLAAYARKRTSTMAISYGAAVAINVTANLILIPMKGAAGAAQATAMSGIVYFAVMWWLLYPRSPASSTRSDLEFRP